MKNKIGKNIELRSEKVNNVIGQIPSYFLRYGILIIVLVLVVIIFISSFLPYKETIPILINVQTIPKLISVKSPDIGMFLSADINNEHIVEKNETVGYIKRFDSLIMVRALLTGEIMFNISNGENVNKKTILFFILPSKFKLVYGESLIDNEYLSKIYINDKISVYYNQNLTLDGYISHIYPVLLENGKMKIRIEFNNINTDNIMYTTQLEGMIILFEGTILQRINKLF